MFPSTAAAAKLPRETTLRTYGKRKVAVLPHSFIGLGVPAVPPPAAAKAPPARPAVAATAENHDPFALPDGDDTDPIEARLKRIRTGTSKAAAPTRAQDKSKTTLFDYPFVDKSPMRKTTAAARRRKLKEQEDADWKPDAATAKKALRKPRKTTKRAVAESAGPVPAPEEIAPSAASDDTMRIAATVSTSNDDDVAPAPTSNSNDNEASSSPHPSTRLATPAPRRRSIVEPRVVITIMSRSPAVASPRNPTLLSHPSPSPARTTASPAPASSLPDSASPVPVPASPRAQSTMLDVPPSTDSGLAESLPDDDMDVDPILASPPLPATAEPVAALEPLLASETEPELVPTRADPPSKSAMTIDWDAPFTFTADELAVAPSSSPRAPAAPATLRSSPIRAPPSPPTHPLLDNDDDAMDIDSNSLVLTLLDRPQPAVPAPNAPSRERTDSGVGEDMPIPAVSAPDASTDDMSEDDDDDRNVPFFLSPHAAGGASSSDEDDQIDHTDSPLANRSVAVRSMTAPVPSGLQQLVALSSSPPPSSPLGAILVNGAGQLASSSPARTSPASDASEHAVASPGANRTPQVSSPGPSAVDATPLPRFIDLTKLGEASYSDVYLVRRPAGAPPVANGSRETVVKIMPFTVPDPRTPTPRRHRAAVRDRRMSVAAIRRAEPGTPVRGRPPPVVDEDEDDAPETRDVAMLVPELAVALRVAHVPGFLPTVQVDVVRAPGPDARDREGYHPALLAAFDAFAIAVPHVAWNPRPPAVVPVDAAPMWYCAVHMPHGGTPLEDAAVRDVWGCLVQIATAVGVAERECEFEHRDLHWGNVLVDKDEVCRVIDFTFARCVVAEGGGVQYAPIPDHVFDGDEDEDEQFAVYRRMREVVERGGKGWSGYYPRTNVLWLQYLARKLVTKTDDVIVQKALMDVADRLVSVLTAADAVPVIEATMAAAARAVVRSA
ncbi:hypothetical protein AMAG_17101 [Allomyces macrogynus ATCC 38327]|uniref:non-specific serine/threonine protein kinase n=1 Tax=Allomyces macrogynus (strain ATCC 38327) TaxID=578462 RepID=A0A0L0TCY0_ALLM3|nr:hypothetical protein AMAG_17101 [Allomyces macrogynus ATCC 38327]|eukprot:KNE72773.1 hypothetical protein AMAG_17101 [Allomyces macrogynus ATCC 38327]